MATLEKKANFSGSNGGGYAKITYTAQDGTVTLSGLAFKATNSTSAGYGAYYDASQTRTFTLNSVGKSTTVKNVRIKQTSYYNATLGASQTGTDVPNNSTLNFTVRARSKSPNTLTYNFTIPMTYSTYTISYDANGGSSTPSSQTKTYGTNLTIANGISHSNTTQNGYTVTFNANNGSTTKTSQTATDTVGWSFSGWKSSATGTTWAGGATNFSENNTTTLTAQWSTSISSRGSVTLPTTAQCTRTNYTLLGWSTSSTATSASWSPGATYTPDTSRTLYAVWQINNAPFNLNILNPDGSEPYSTGEAGTVQFSSDGGSSYSRIYNEPTGEYVQGTAFRAKNFEPGAHRYLSSTSGFDGGSGTDGDPGYATQGSSTTLNFYTAGNRYGNDVNVYNPNGVQDYESAYFDLYTSENDSHRYNLLNEDNDMTHVYGSYFEVSNIRPYHDYYELDHVDGYDSIPTTGTYRKIFDAANEVLGVYVRYKSYTIIIRKGTGIYDITAPNGGGTGNYKTNSLQYGTSLNINASLQTGYHGKNGSGTFSTATQNYTFTVTGAVDITANGEANTYTVSYNANGGTGTTASSSHTYDVAKNLTSNGFSRSGYTFLGGSTNSSATTATYNNGQSVTNLTSVNGGTVILYAIGQLNTYTISYASNGGSSTPFSQTKTHGVNLTIAAAISHNNSVTDGYTVTFNANEGTTTKSSETATDITSYAFAGGKSSATNTVGSGGATNFNENNVTTLTAQGTPTTTHGSVTLPTAEQCTRANYILLGFSTNSTATTATYQPGASYTPASNIILYAIGQTTTKQVDYKVNGVGKKGVVYIKTGEIGKLSYRHLEDTDYTVEIYTSYDDLVAALSPDSEIIDVTIENVSSSGRRAEKVYKKIDGVGEEAIN